jgi:hypothetical protein
MTDAYHQFIASKRVVLQPNGLSDIPALPARLFPFQRAITERHLRLGRGAIFAGTGLGKTGMQLAWADAVERDQRGPILILTPLAVAQQTVAEAEKFGIAGVAYARDQAGASTRIVVTNYDRHERFDPARFAGIVLDESGILKSAESQTRIALTDAFARHQFRLCCTATPAPNDFTELGNHAEFLGIMTAKEMLATFFVHDGGIRAGESGDAAGWRLKRHGQRDFWAWVASWATMIRHPRELGFEQAGYDLPELRKRQVTVPADYAPSIETGTLFPIAANTLSERIGARRESINKRVAEAARIVNAEPDKAWLVWCHLNAEADRLAKAIPGSLQVQGSDSAEVKTERLLGFCHGRPRVLISKPSICGHGMNWQHCHSMVFVGLNDSFEQLFQALRRCWRFGQEKPVTAYLIASELEGAVVANLEAKERDYETMAAAMAEHMRDFNRAALGQPAPRDLPDNQEPMELPEWLTAA